jgi:hypothetical protein
MDGVIEKVRSRVLDLVSGHEELYDANDVTSHIRTRNGLISMFCERFRETHAADQEYDIECISQNLLETLAYRKSIGISSMRIEDFPKEMWEADTVRMYEDDEVNITIWNIRNYYYVSRKWSNVWARFFIMNHDHDVLEAVHKGKKCYSFADAHGMGFANLDITMVEECFRMNDKHFPSLYQNLGLYGIPRFMHSIAEWIIKFCMPDGFRHRFRIYDSASMIELLGTKYVPPGMGGECVLQPLIDTSKYELGALRIMARTGD